MQSIPDMICLTAGSLKQGIRYPVWLFDRTVSADQGNRENASHTHCLPIVTDKALCSPAAAIGAEAGPVPYQPDARA